MLPVFGAVLVLTAVKMLFMDAESRRSGEERRGPPDAEIPACDGTVRGRTLLRESARA